VVGIIHGDSAGICPEITVKMFANLPGSLVRHLPGGMGHVNVLTSMILAGISGSSVSDVSGTFLGQAQLPKAYFSF
jgi:TRAP-type C4-dicarboxylate transport system permease large subunit